MTTTRAGNDWFLLYREGDENAFTKAFDLYYRSIVYYAAKILREDSYAEDIVSETFNKAWDNRARLETPRHLENFLYLVTRNACISYLRGDKAHNRSVIEWDRIRGAEEEDQPAEAERVQAEMIQKIEQYLERLPGGIVLRMSYLEGKSTKEIASQLDMTENAVYIAKSRALKALRQILDNNMPAFLFFLVQIFY